MGQFYTYLHYLVDLQLRRITDALQASGLIPNPPMEEDDNEEVNLASGTATGEPIVRDPVEIPAAWGIGKADVQAALDYMEPLLYETLERQLGQVSGVPAGESTGRSAPRRVRFGAGFRVASKLEEGALPLSHTETRGTEKPGLRLSISL